MYQWTADRIEWYDRAVRFTGFSDKVAEFLSPHMPPNESVCDLGCGTGHLAMALARRGYRVKAADRNPLVLDFLRRESERRGLNVGIVDADWHTLSTPLSENITMVFAGRLDTELPFYLELCGKRLLLVVKNSPQSHVKNDGETSPSYVSKAHLLQALETMNLHYQVEDHRVEFGQPLRSVEEAEAYIASFNDRGFRPAEITDRLIQFDDSEFPLYLPNEKRVALFVIDKQ